jgi:DNA invertase Pin-like site-specific DNA recombinase
MTIAAYIRVSSKAQDHATQRAAIERLATARGETVGAWYAEKLSGKTMARPELVRLRSDAAAGQVRKLYVFRLDRLTRTGIKDTLQALEDFRGAGVDVVSVADGFDLNGPCAEVIVSVMAWAAKMERLATNERISAARERIEAEGGAWGRPPKMTAAQSETAHRMRSEGASLRAIAQAIGVSKTIVGRAIKGLEATAA